VRYNVDDVEIVGASRDGTKEYVRTRKKKRTLSPGHDRERKNLEAAVVMDIIERSSLQPCIDRATLRPAGAVAPAIGF
jgi:hypothetical protein